MNKEEIEKSEDILSSAISEAYPTWSCAGYEEDSQKAFEALEKISNHIQQLETKVKEMKQKEQKIRNRLEDALDFAITGDGQVYSKKKIEMLQNILNLYKEGDTNE